MNILVVDDTSINLQLVARLLERRGHTVIKAENGAEAVNQFQNQRFDLILMDLQMPVLDGITACKEIRELEQVNSMPSKSKPACIIAMSANDDAEDKEACFQAGMNGFLSKPLDMSSVFSTIESFFPASG